MSQNISIHIKIQVNKFKNHYGMYGGGASLPLTTFVEPEKVQNIFTI